MSELTELSIAVLRDRFTARDVSAREVTDAYLAAIEAHNPRAQRLRRGHGTSGRGRWREASDERLAKGEARPLEGIPLAIKDLYATRGVHTQACSAHPRQGVRAALRIHRYAELVGRRARSCSARRTWTSSRWAPPTRRPATAPPSTLSAARGRTCEDLSFRADRPAGRPRRWRRTSAPARRPPTPAARSASPPPSPAPSA